jgi:hypothetical protein
MERAPNGKPEPDTATAANPESGVRVMAGWAPTWEFTWELTPSTTRLAVTADRKPILFHRDLTTESSLALLNG